MWLALFLKEMPKNKMKIKFVRLQEISHVDSKRQTGLEKRVYDGGRIQQTDNQ